MIFTNLTKVMMPIAIRAKRIAEMENVKVGIFALTRKEKNAYSTNPIEMSGREILLFIFLENRTNPVPKHKKGNNIQW